VSEDLVEAVLRLVAATVAGMAIGLNRDLADKPMGMRTLGLVSLGSALATLATTNFGILGFHADAISRTIQGILTGVGFIGGGVILRDIGRRTVYGLTTAATVWIAAALGITCGLGAWRIAIVGGAITLILLILGGPFERLIHLLRTGERLAADEHDGEKAPPKDDHIAR
jgi:putative Mg2+ transporter-C (MgtC) family protein